MDGKSRTYDDCNVNIVAVPTALLCSLKGCTRVQAMVALGADTQTSDVGGRIRDGHGDGWSLGTATGPGIWGRALLSRS